MPEFDRITVTGDAPYDVVIGRNLLGEVAQALTAATAAGPVKKYW